MAEGRRKGLTMKKVMITGAGGFAGRNLAEYLPGRGYDVHAFTRQALDLLDEAAVLAKLSRLQPDVIIHCATVGGSRKTGYDAGSTDVVAKNLRMFFNLARALKPGMRMLNMGSGAEYDKRRALVKIDEKRYDERVPDDAYGYAKYVISKYTERTENVTSLRIFGLYGKYEDYTYKFISNAIVKNLLGMPIVVNRNVVFDYLWAGDFCRLIERFLSIKPKHRHYNITPTKSADLLTLAKVVNINGKSKLKVIKNGFNPEYTGNNSRMLKELGKFDFTSYAEGIDMLRAYYAANLNKLDLRTVKKDPYLNKCR